MPKSLFILMMLSITVPTFTSAQSGGNFEIVKSSINGGGGTLAGGAYEITGSIAQTTTLTSSMQQWQIQSGFWPSNNILLDIIFKNGFEAIINTFN